MCEDSAKVRAGRPGFDSCIKGAPTRKDDSSIWFVWKRQDYFWHVSFFYSGAKGFDESGIFVTLSQNTSEIKSDFKFFGWDFQKLIDDERIML